MCSIGNYDHYILVKIREKYVHRLHVMQRCKSIFKKYNWFKMIWLKLVIVEIDDRLNKYK